MKRKALRERYIVKVYEGSDWDFPGLWFTLGSVYGKKRETRVKHAKELLKKYRWSYRYDLWKIVKVK